MNDSHMVAFRNLVRDQCDVTHWGEVDVGYDFQGKVSDLNRNSSAVQCQKDA